MKGNIDEKLNKYFIRMHYEEIEEIEEKFHGFFCSSYEFNNGVMIVNEYQDGRRHFYKKIIPISKFNFLEVYEVGMVVETISNTSIEHCFERTSYRAVEILQANGYMHLKDLLGMPKIDILKIKGIGKTSLQCIIKDLIDLLGTHYGLEQAIYFKRRGFINKGTIDFYNLMNRYEED